MGEVASVGIPSIFGLTGIQTAYKHQDVLLGQAQVVNFKGLGVNAILDGDVLTIDISGGGSAITVVQNIEDNTKTVPSSAVLFNFGYELSQTLSAKAALDSPTFTGNPTAPTADGNANNSQIANTQFVQSVVANQVSGLWKDQGNFDASGGSWPTSANTIALDSIKAGYLWKVSVEGTLTGGIVLSVGDFIRALVDDAGDTAVDWAANESNIGYVPENQANKVTDFTTKDHVKFPSTQAVDENYLSLDPLQTLTEEQKTDVKTKLEIPTGDLLKNGTNTDDGTNCLFIRSTGCIARGISNVIMNCHNMSIHADQKNAMFTNYEGEVLDDLPLFPRYSIVTGYKKSETRTLKVVSAFSGTKLANNSLTFIDVDGVKLPDLLGAGVHFYSYHDVTISFQEFGGYVGKRRVLVGSSGVFIQTVGTDLQPTGGSLQVVLTATANAGLLDLSIALNALYNSNQIFAKCEVESFYIFNS